jgi:two-component system nitrogen regulation response regulator NtrX
VSREDVLQCLGGTRPELGAALTAAHTLKEFRAVSERLFLLRKLEESDWNVTATAKAIETPRSNLYKKMEQYGISREDAE